MDCDAHENAIIEVLTSYCCNILPKQKVIVECIDMPTRVTTQLVERILSLGATPILNQKSQATIDLFAAKGTQDVYAAMAETELFQMRQAEHFIGLRSPLSNSQIAHISPEQMQLVLKRYVEPVHYNYRNHKLNWIYMRWPSEYMAQRAKMNFDAFSEYYQKAVHVDFTRMELAMEPLVEMLRKTSNVHIIGPGDTDLSFKLNRLGEYKSVGKKNLPDGEVFTAPVRGSVNGTISFNIDSTYYGTMYSGIRLTFKNGKVVDAIAKNNGDRLLEILNIDEGARYIGEFAIGVNPVIDRPINDILFDEKMHGSIHFALGNAYPVADNGNRSGIHWDLILNQKEIYGGGELYFDGILVRKNGKFVTESLNLLNPEYL